MAKQFGGGRRNRNTSFGKRQDADEAFRKKKKERGSSGKPGDDDRGERRGFRGSSYEGGTRKYSTGRGERKSFRSGKPNSDENSNRRSSSGDSSRGESSYRRSSNRYEGSGRGGNSGSGNFRGSFGKSARSRSERGDSYEKKSYGDKPFRSRNSGGPRTGKPYRNENSDRSKSNGRSFNKKERDEYSRKKSFGDKPSGRSNKERRSFVEAKIESHRDRVERPAQNEQAQGDGLIRLNKFISNSGVCSRREADELIKMGVITVNGTTITEMGYKVKPTDDVRHDGKKLSAEKPVYILLNKPKGFITTTDDPQERNTVMQLIAGACKERVYPVGRLDRNTTGLLLLTNDGELTDKLTHPSFNAKKIYKVELDKPLTKADFERIVEGVTLEEGKAIVDDLAIVSDDSKTVGIELHIGWNHVVRRIFNALEYDVVKLDRVVYAGLDKKDLKRGQWRFLKNEEIVRLKHFK